MQLWVDVLAGSFITGIAIKWILTIYVAAILNEIQIFVVATGISIFIWGSIFLVANRGALDQLSCRIVFSGNEGTQI